MKINGWTSSIIITGAVCLVLFLGVENNKVIIGSTPIDLDLISNKQMEEVVKKNPGVLGMRMSLANRYLAEGDFTNALPHYVFIASNDQTGEFKSTALSQIGWMSYESGEVALSLEYIKESIRLDSENVLGNTYLGIILLEQNIDKEKGLSLLKQVLGYSEMKFSEKALVSRYIDKYEE